MQPQLPGTAESHLLGSPRALPLYPIASTFSSTWSVTTVPTCSRAQVERFASSSAMRMYTSYNGMRSTGGAVAPSGNTLRKCVLAGTPSLKTLMQLLIGIVVAVAPAGALFVEPGVEPRRHQPVGACLTLRGACRERVGVFVLRVSRMTLDPTPLDLVRRRGLHQLLPELLILEHAALALPAAGPPAPPWARRPCQGWMTTGISVCRRISSAWDTTTALGRPSLWLMCAPANSASQRIRLITRATTSPGFPDSTCVTNATRCIESVASATPTTWSPASRSSLAWMR